ncbi:MAG: hypothetical protein WDA16_14790, partial [Candidatus Thermoplasmatota archaeon]
WGLPAIDEMKANVEYRSVQMQFSELDSTIRELVAGTTERTAKRWQPAINRGSVSVMNNTEPWLFATEFYNTSTSAILPQPYTNFTWTNLKDGDNTLRIYNKGRDLNAVKVEAFIVTGTASLTTLNVSAPGGTFPLLVGPFLGEQMTGANLPSFPNGSYYDFEVYKVVAGSTTTPQNLDGQTFKFRIWTGTTLLSEAWYLNTSRIDYVLHGPVTEKTITSNNGALITGSGTTSTTIISNSPPLPPITNNTGLPRFFGRILAINGTSSFAGENRFDLLISLYSTVTLASYDCGKNDSSDCAVSSKIYVWGSQSSPWQTYLNSTNQGYHYGKYYDSLSGETVLEDRQWKMAYTLLESNVRVTG